MSNDAERHSSHMMWHFSFLAFSFSFGSFSVMVLVVVMMLCGAANRLDAE